MTDDPLKNYFEVAVTAPVSKPLTYLPPDTCDQPLLPGLRVLVPLGGRKITGYILERLDAAPVGQQLKKIEDVLDHEPLFPPEQVGFYKWIAAYYHYPIGEVIKAALPAGLTKKSGRRILLTESGRIHIQGLAEKSSEEFPWLKSLLEKGEISPYITAKLWSTKIRRIFESWEKEGWVIVKNELVGGSVKIKTETCCALSEYIGSVQDLKVSEQKTIDALKKLAAATKSRFVPRRELMREYRGAGRGLKALVQKKYILLEEQQVYRDPFGDCFLESDVPEELTEEQKRALDTIFPAIIKGHYSPFLLHGVTGSGKTEVYLQAAAKTLEQNKSVLVLVPEIALATQLEAHFLGRFGSRVALLHSGLSSGQRFDQRQEPADRIFYS